MPIASVAQKQPLTALKHLYIMNCLDSSDVSPIESLVFRFTENPDSELLQKTDMRCFDHLSYSSMESVCGAYILSTNFLGSKSL
jgi:hypothetical protein